LWASVLADRGLGAVLSNSTSPAILHRQARLSIEDQIFFFLVCVKLGRLTFNLTVALKVSPPQLAEQS